MLEKPSWVPPNLHFQVDDAEDPWLFNRNNPFDYIHMRDLGGSIRDWPKLQREAYEHLKPGGWFEIQEFEVTLKSDDDTMPLAPALCEYLSELHRASDIFQKPFNIAAMHEQWMVETGFEQVKDETYKVRLTERFFCFQLCRNGLRLLTIIYAGPFVRLAKGSPLEGDWPLQLVLVVDGCGIVFLGLVHACARVEQ